MQILKVIGLGTLFWVCILIMHAVVGMVLGRHASHAAVALSALRAGTIYNPYFWLTLLVAYGAAFWLIKRHA